MSDAFEQLFVPGVSIHGGGEGRDVAGEPLRQEQVPACPVDVGDRGVPERVEGVEVIESRLHLPGPECELDSALADADARLGAEEAIVRQRSLAPCVPRTYEVYASARLV